MVSELKKETFNALKWSVLERFGKQGVQFVFSVVLARLVMPAEYGLIAMLFVFISVGNSIVNSGFSHALIQKKNSTYIDECSIFYFNIVIAGLLVIILYLAAPFVADFYEQPRLLTMTKVISVIYIFNALGLVQRTLLNKALDFKTQLKVSMLTTFLSGGLSTTMAFHDYGVWSLVMLHISNDFLHTAFIWHYSKWRPSLIFNFASLKLMLPFGSRLFVVSILNSLFSNINQIVIGKFYNPSLLGFYGRADSLYKFPVTIINSVVSQVSFPVFSRIQDDLVSLQSVHRKSISIIAFLIFPIMSGLILLAPSLVEILLTEKWLPSVFYLQLLSVIGMVLPFLVVNGNIINALGRSDIYMKIDASSKILSLCILFISYRWGISAMILGQILNTIIIYFLQSAYINKFLNISVLKQLALIFPSIIISLCMALLMYGLTMFDIESLWVQFVVQSLIGLFVFFALMFLYDRSIISELKSLIKLNQ